jgi:hypothetical protein
MNWIDGTSRRSLTTEAENNLWGIGAAEAIREINHRVQIGMTPVDFCQTLLDILDDIELDTIRINNSERP